MRAIQNAGGHVGLTARSYPVEGKTAISAGQVVKLKDGLVVAAVAAEKDPILGIAAENHPGVADCLNLRANGQEILVYDNPALIFECPVPTVKAASGGSGTTIKATTGNIAADVADDAFNGGVLVLVEKANQSKNTDPIGTVIRVTDYAKDGLTFTKASGGTPNEGDVYEVYPPLYFTAGGLDTGAAKLVLTATGAESVMVVGHDRERHMIRCMAAIHALNGKEATPAPVI